MLSKLHSAPQNGGGEATIGNNDDGAPVILHPLVVLNVSDHYTRYAAIRMFSKRGSCSSRRGLSSSLENLTNGDGNPRVIGLLLGTQRGRIVEVCHSFELTAKRDEHGSVQVDAEFMQSRIEQYRQIFAQYTVVGWYSTGIEVSSDDLRLHEEVFTLLNETPILLLMNPSQQARGGDTSASANTISNDENAMRPERADASALTPTHTSAGMLSTYQMELKVVEDKPKRVLVRVAHRYASEDSERIAIDHVMRHAVPGGGDGTSSTALHLASLRSSIKMLHTRLRLITKFLEATLKGDIPVDHQLLRQVSGVCARLPALDCVEFSHAFADEKNDSLVVSYLGGVTKTLCSLSETLDMFNRFNVRTANAGPPRRRNAFNRS